MTAYNETLEGGTVVERTVLFVLIGYLSGSVLFANVFGDLFGVRERYAQSADKNPGSANAFTYGGFWCGTLTVLCELAKGAAPVYFYLRTTPFPGTLGLFCVLTAPVVGHILPVFYGFRGGKGIAVTFGVLIGLAPFYIRPLLLFAAVFVFLSVFVKISPHFYRTIAAYLVTSVMMLLGHAHTAALLSFMAVTELVCLRMALGHEEKERLEIKLLWKR